MTFWDSSALVPLLVEEKVSKACRVVRRSYPVIAVWTLTRVELTSALQRLVREEIALQLGAALVLVSERPRHRPFVTCDDRLAQAATAEGFEVIVPVA